MKTRFFVCILIFIIVTLSACGSQEQTITTENDILPEQTTSSREEEITQDVQTTVDPDLETIQAAVAAAKWIAQNQKDSMVSTETRKVWRDIPRTIELSRFIFLGTCQSEADEDGLYLFSVEKNYRGVEQEELYVDCRNVTSPQIGGTYLFFGSAFGNVMKNRVFYLAMELIPQKEGPLETTAIQETDGWTWDRLISELSELVTSHPSEEPSRIIGEFITSTDPETVLAESKYVGILRVQDIVLELEDRIWCQCSVVQMEKGSLSHKTIILVAPINAVEAGKEYRAAFSDSDESEGIFYIVSSPNSVYQVK